MASLSGAWPTGQRWPVTGDEWHDVAVRLDKAGVPASAFRTGLANRGYESLREVVPERRDSVVAGIIDDWRSRRCLAG